MAYLAFLFGKVCNPGNHGDADLMVNKRLFLLCICHVAMIEAAFALLVAFGVYQFKD